VKKKRFCNQKRRSDSLFCGNHAQLDNEIVTSDSVMETRVSHNNESDITFPAAKKRCINKRSKDTDHRIPCPIDPSHTIWNYALAKHIKKCPKAREIRLLENLPYYKKGINCGKASFCQSTGSNTTTNDTRKFSLDEAKNLAYVILKVYMKLFRGISMDDLSARELTYSDIYSAIPANDTSSLEQNAGLSDQMRLFKVKTGGSKHLKQQASFVGNLRDIGALPKLNGSADDDRRHSDRYISNIVEMGAGRAMLGLVVAGVANAALNGNKHAIQMSDNDQKVSLYMIERGSSKGKADTRLRTVNSEAYDDYHKKAAKRYIDLRGINIERLKCDLADINLSDALPNDDIYFVVGKHVCGVATDLALRSLSSIKGSCRGCAFATCCHGICNWVDFVGKSYLVDAFKRFDFHFGEEHFEKLVQWTGGSTLLETVVSNDTVTEAGDDDHKHLVVHDESSETGIKQIVMEAKICCGVRGLGRACQRIIDYGRREYMRDVLGFRRSSHILYYVDESVTPQNALLIGSS
jgi:tRNA:m4X modification enzyme